MSFNRKILIVDDEPHVRILLKSRLEANGYAVVTAYGGMQALEKVKEEKPHLILLDIVMPDLNGYEVAQKLKSDPETAKIPIIIFTASNVRELEDKCRDLGVDYVIMKPFSPEVMLGMVKELFKKSES